MKSVSSLRAEALSDTRRIIRDLPFLWSSAVPMRDVAEEIEHLLHAVCFLIETETPVKA